DILSSRYIYHVIYYFFFSSRRRHTRFSRDWSSDVCSSDLLYIIGPVSGPQKIGFSKNPQKRLKSLQTAHPQQLILHYTKEVPERSEERRVGKECRSRGAPKD